MKIESLSNGLGCQSMLLMLMACRREIPATVSITADTGWEFDRLWSNGRRGTAQQYFSVCPLAMKCGFDARMVRSVNKFGIELPGLREAVKSVSESTNFNALSIPMFGSRGGRVTQRCTDKMKIRALRQEARRMGATENCNAQGIHIDEALRRASGEFICMNGPWSIYQTQIKRGGEWVDVKWQSHYYPLVDLKLTREDCRKRMDAEGIPYLLSTECDGCPHKDFERWSRTSPETLEELAEIERRFKGEFFFTDKRIPLLQAIDLMKNERKSEVDFGCANAICGV